jgi:hypothetical protein
MVLEVLNPMSPEAFREEFLAVLAKSMHPPGPAAGDAHPPATHAYLHPRPPPAPPQVMRARPPRMPNSSYSGPGRRRAAATRAGPAGAPPCSCPCPCKGKGWQREGLNEYFD